MSADNYIGVREVEGFFYVTEGSMSILDEDCQYVGHTLKELSSREQALVYAHDRMKNEYIVEYGVIELSPIPEKPCGRCYVCINVRNIVAEDIQRCDGCGDPISSNDWMCMTSEGIFHHRCEPREV